MRQTRRRFSLRYGIPLLAIALATAVRILLEPALGQHLLFAPFIVAVVFSAWFGGLVPSLVALVIGLSDVLCLFVPHDGTLGACGLKYQIGFYTLAGITSAFFIESLRGAYRRAEKNARQALAKQKELEQEIAERQQAQEALRRQREWWQVTLASIGDAVIVTDTNEQVVFMNSAAQELTGWQHQDAVGKPLANVFRIVHGQTRQPVENPAHKALLHGGTVQRANDVLLLAKDNTAQPIDDSAAPILDPQGQVLGVILVFRNISQRKAMEEEIRRQADILKETDRRKDEFLALLAHELRNPLAPLRSAVHILRLGATEDAQMQWARDVMERQVQQLTRLVDDLLDVSRISRGKIRLRQERVDVAALVHQAVETSRPVIEERQHDLTVSLPAEPLQVMADPARLEQILVNLLNNAAKYTQRGGHIWLAACREANEITLRVKDTGIGIPADLLPRIFDPFVQADQSLSRSQDGLGIGLALVKRLVELHGGRINAHSHGPNQGSEFVVRLPSVIGWPASKDMHAQETVSHARPSCQGHRILMVDDNTDAAEALAVLLRLQGHEVFVASDGLTALEVVADFQPDVVVSDIGMPGVDGYELARQLRAQPAMEGVLLVALTGWGQEMDRCRSRMAGFDHHLVKPVEVDALQQLLAKF